MTDKVDKDLLCAGVKQNYKDSSVQLFELSELFTCASLLFMDFGSSPLCCEISCQPAQTNFRQISVQSPLEPAHC